MKIKSSTLCEILATTLRHRLGRDDQRIDGICERMSVALVDYSGPSLIDHMNQLVNDALNELTP